MLFYDGGQEMKNLKNAVKMPQYPASSPTVMVSWMIKNLPGHVAPVEKKTNNGMFVWKKGLNFDIVFAN